MANNYTFYSAVIEKIKKKELEWWRKEIEEESEAEEDGSYPDFLWKYIERDKQIWIYAEEGGNLENIACTVQAFLEKFRPNDVWGMEFAFTCSKPRLGEFGGGAMVVTAKKTYWLNTGTWMDTEMDKLRNK